MDILPEFGIYVFTTIVILVVGTLQGSWLDSTDQQVICFRKPKMLRLGAGMASSIFLVAAIFFALSAVRQFGVLFTWLWNVPLSIFLTALLAFLAGPQDVFIDLETRLCYKIDGWMFHPRKNTYHITEVSSLSICSGGQTYYVFLMIGGGSKQWFLLARPEQKTDAICFAQAIADKLHLPVKETNFRELRELS